MQTKLPEQAGWYWAKWLLDDSWCMAYVDSDRSILFTYPRDGGGPGENLAVSLPHIKDEWHWYGPINCPGSEFSDCTIIASEELHNKASDQAKAIVIHHVDYTHCARPTHAVTITSLLSADEADTLINRETSQAARETTLVKLFRELDFELGINGIKLTARGASIVNGMRSLIAELDDE